jgi:hypothetical protein
MEKNEILFSVQKIQPGKTAEVREWFADWQANETDLFDALAAEGIDVESVFIESRDDGDYLCYYIAAEDVTEMLETFEASDEYDEFKDFIDRCLVGGLDAYHEHRPELIFHTEVPADSA